MSNYQTVVELLKRGGGILKLRPEFVHRFYPDLNRLGQRRLKRSSRQFIPERWIGSTVAAVNPPPMPSGGLSMLDVPRHVAPICLRDAIKAAPMELLGQDILDAHGPEFRVLVKILDPGEPIVFHLHATDAQVARMKQNFRGHRFGKDEAYYFLDAPKGPQAYTHAGLWEGVTHAQLVRAIERGREYALELSPSFYQTIGEGFFVPAGVPHRPGTALTLEIQQPSDVYTLLELYSAGKPMPPAQRHPGFRTLEQAMKLIDVNVAQRVGRLEGFRLKPVPIERKHGGGQVTTIFPVEVCRKFAGRRIHVSSRLSYSESLPFVMLIWRGRGTVNGRSFRAGDEFFVCHDAAAHGIELHNSGDELVEAFTFLPAV